MLSLALVRLLEIIGEAARGVSAAHARVTPRNRLESDGGNARSAYPRLLRRQSGHRLANHQPGFASPRRTASANHSFSPFCLLTSRRFIFPDSFRPSLPRPVLPLLSGKHVVARYFWYNTRERNERAVWKQLPPQFERLSRAFHGRSFDSGI